MSPNLELQQDEMAGLAQGLKYGLEAITFRFPNGRSAIY